MRATPRYRARVPIVTASDGSRSRVTSRPLTAPAAMPTTASVTKMAGIGQPRPHRKPSSALDMPRIDATDRSISPLMMISVIGSVMIAISPLDSPRLNRLLLVRNCGETDAPTAPTITTTTASPVSQRSSGRSRSLMAASSQPQRDAQPDRDEPIHGDGHDEQETPDGLVPERRDAQHVERGADRVEQQCAERRAHRAAAPAEDRHPADHDGRYHREFVAGPGGGVDGAVLCGPQHARHPGDRAAHRERDEDPPADRDPGQPGRVGIGPDRVELAPGPERPQVVGAD